MSKRSRGSARVHRRPGTRPPTARPAGARPTRPAAASGPLTIDESSELEMMAAESPALAEPSTRQATQPTPVRSAHARLRAKPGSVLASRSATEYVYVGQDLRRILIVSAVLLAVMIAAWLLIAVFGVIPLDFY